MKLHGQRRKVMQEYASSDILISWKYYEKIMFFSKKYHSSRRSTKPCHWTFLELLCLFAEAPESINCSENEFQPHLSQTVRHRPEELAKLRTSQKTPLPENQQKDTKAKVRKHVKQSKNSPQQTKDKSAGFTKVKKSAKALLETKP